MRRLVLLLVLLLAVPSAAAARPGFGWPLAGAPVVDRAFSPPTSSYGAGHRGVDLRASVGARVLAAGPGQVTYASVLAGRGVVTVTHSGGLRTTYEPVTATVHVGQWVVRGTVLGRLGSGHASCRAGVACLHWGLLRGQTYLDPLALVVPADVRLLPLDEPASGQPIARAPEPAATEAVSPQARVTRAPGRPGRRGPAGSLGALVATGALVSGLGLLVRRPAGPPTPPAPGGGPAPPVARPREPRRRPEV